MTTTPDPITGALPLPNEEARALLARVLQAAGLPSAAIVFDLDSTLLDNSPRQARIMREYGSEVGIEALTTVGPEQWSGWDHRIPMRRVGLSDREVDAHAARFKDYWRERFFTSEYCTEDRPIAGASDYVNAVVGTGAIICYVTGRHEPMRAGSVASFEAAGFPIPNATSVHLIMKPKLSESDDAYKLRTYEALHEIGQVAAAFDNEPAHINGYRRAFPEAIAVHLATDHSMRDIKVADGIVSIRDFASWC